MQVDERLRWLETRISSSLRPRNEDLKQMIQNDENRLAFHEFINNEDVRRLFVFIRPPKQIIASLQPPHDLTFKSIFFMKCGSGNKITKENIREEVYYTDCSDVPLEHIELLTREVYLPLLCIDQSHASALGINADKLMDVLHRLMATVEVAQGHIEGQIVLPFPSIEVLAEAAANPSRRGAVLHVLESTVIGWIKQIKGILKHDPIHELDRHFGPHPGPLDEISIWEQRLQKLHSINEQLDSPVAVDILRNLEDANSQYAHSFENVRKEIYKAEQETNEILKFLGTLSPWFDQLHAELQPLLMMKLFPPLIHTIMLVWSRSRYYHLPDQFHNLLRVISNEVVHRAEAMVGEDVLHEPLESYTKLKEALRVCAAFRGTYLDYKDKADEMNGQNVQDNSEKMLHRPQGVLWNTKMYGSGAYTPKYGVRPRDVTESQDELNEDLWMSSPWPPRNAPCFDLLNAFMERCNDVLELVQTTRHFRLLADAAAIGGAGSQSLDALVKEIDSKYKASMEEFFSYVTNVLSIDGTQAFEKAFFSFRSVVKDLERKLADILRASFMQCPTIGAQLRLLEVFEGISSRELVQQNLRDKDTVLVKAFMQELIQVRNLFNQDNRHPPTHRNMPPVVSKLLWVHALRQRVQIPMEKMKRVSPHSLEGDSGWQLRDQYNEAMQDFKKYTDKISNEWQSNITAELTTRLKQPLLVAEEYDEDVDQRPQVVHVNLDPKLLLLLREIHYLSQEPHNIHLPAPARELLRNTNAYELRVTATRLETIVSKYNVIMRTITDIEKPLFERKLAKIDNLFEEGLNHYTWKTKESADFIEISTSLVCLDVHQNLDVVQTNCHDVAEITISWSQGMLDVFSSRQSDQSYSMENLVSMQSVLDEEFENHVVPSGNKIHSLLQGSFGAVQISQASPAWVDYVDYIDAIVLDGLKQATLASLKSMLNTIVQCNMNPDGIIPILTIRLELIENEVAFRPPLDQSTSVISVQELVKKWLEVFVARGKLVNMLGGNGDYKDYIQVDEEVQYLLEQINKLVEENGEECKKLFQLFKDYSFLWIQDVNQTFDEFLNGKVSPNPLRQSSKPNTTIMREVASAASRSSRASSIRSIDSQGLVGTAEKTFLTPKQSREAVPINVPSLDEFDAEIDIYRTARDEVYALEDHQDVGWLRVDLQPIKQVLTTYASKWMWTFTKYLSDQVTIMLQGLDQFLKRIEPELESISGEERDTASFMKIMRLFNEVSAQQSEMDGKFGAMHRTVLLLKKYSQKLPDVTQQLFNAAPGRWNNLKTKVSLAKQRLGPRIQEESERITKDLAAFGERVNTLNTNLEDSEVYNRDYSIGDAYSSLDNFMSSLTVLENEAQDLIELQELLETSVVNFSILPQCRHDLNNLKQVWETVRLIDDQQSEWKRHRWQKMNTKFLRDETNKQLDIVKTLPEDVFMWDVYMGLLESITTIQACLPLIDDLSNPAMRTRHWKQLVRVTGGALQIDNDTLKRMTLGELLSLGLQKHVDDVRAIVQRAVKDLSIEQSLKTYEEVWLSKIFDLRSHVRVKAPTTAGTVIEQSKQDDTQSESHSEAGSNLASKTQMRTTTSASRISNQSAQSRQRRTSVSSLPASLLNMGEDSGQLQLITDTDAIFEQLESHQVSLQAMQGNSAAGSFLDEVIKWQKRLQTIEAVLTAWLEVQDKWVELEEIYTGSDVKITLYQDASLFSSVNRDFRLLMRATEKNPNVLQCCQRKNVMRILEKMNSNLEQCKKSLISHLDRRRQKFPRFYFLSMTDVLHIVCNGYDVNQVNLYVNKLFENVGSLVYEEVDNDRCNFQLKGVESALGERLPLKQPVLCEGAIEGWLTAFLQAIKEGIQYQLATAMGLEKPPPKREIHSAGARRVQVQSRSQSRQGGRGNSFSIGQTPRDNGPNSRSHTPSHRERAGSRSGSRLASSRVKDSRIATPAEQEEESAEQGSRSWTLDHVAEVVCLTTQIQMTQQVNEIIEQMNNGDKDALQVALVKINSSVQATVMMLKGLEDEKEARARKEKAKLEADEKEKEDNERETMSQSTSYKGKSQFGTSNRGSVYDLTIENPQATIPEEGSHADGSEALLEPQTSEPIDTMNLGAVVLIPKKSDHDLEVEIQQNREKQQSEETDLKLMLFPSQIQKISSLISVLTHQRDLLVRLIEKTNESDTNLEEAFDWRSQLQYKFNTEDLTISVKCLDAEFDYGFEYMGSCTREVITPMTEKAFVSLTQAVKANVGGLCMGPSGAGKLATIHELSRALGQPLYMFNCTQQLDSYMLADIFKGFATTGAWIGLNNLNVLSPAVLSVCAQYLSTVLDAIKAGKANVIISTEEVSLSLTGACFATIETSLKAESGNPEKLLLFNSRLSKLPATILNQFRAIAIMRPDMRLTLECMLASQGFLNAGELAHKVTLLYEMCRKLIGTDSPITSNVNLGYDENDGVHGWSLQTLKYVVFEAGAILDKFICEHVEKSTKASPVKVTRDKPRTTEGEKDEADQGQMDPEQIDKIAEETLQMESEALVTALRNSFMPRMKARDASIFTTLTFDLWQGVNVPMNFGGLVDRGSPDMDIESRSPTKMSKSQSRLNKAKSRMSAHMPTFRETLNLNTPVVSLASAAPTRFSALLDQTNKQVLEELEDAIAIATSNLGLLPGTAFQARVAQLAQLNTAHQTIIVCGPPGCGKTDCIKTFALAERERGKIINIQSVFTKAVESEDLLGHWDPKTREWRDGLMASLLRKFCIQHSKANYELNIKPVIKILQMDGNLDPRQMELMSAMLHNDGAIVMGNNERINVSDTLRFVWEMESISNLSPSVLANVGVMAMQRSDVGWELMLAQWLARKNSSDRDMLQAFVDTYIMATVNYLTQCCRPPMLEPRPAKTGRLLPHYKRVIPQTEENMISTMTALMDSMMLIYPDLSETEYERYFTLAVIWAFGGTLEVQYREPFSQWWRRTFEKHIEYPIGGSVFDYMVDQESHEFIKWTELVPAYSATPHYGIPPEAFVHNVNTEQLTYMMGILSDAGKPVMLVGPNGCGKTSIVTDRIRTVCSGEVAEVLALTITTNRFTNAKLLCERLDERTEWKHGRTYVPKGNKRLMCLVDDLNLSQVDEFGNQTATELVRQHIDDGGFYDPITHTWRYIKNVTYVTTVNPNCTATVPKLSQRLLRHFAVFGCPYPSENELQGIFTTLLNTHFITPEMSSTVTIAASTAHHLGIHDEKVKNVIREEEEALKLLLSLMVKVNIELQDKMCSMFLPTAQRCHYIFTMNDLGRIFRNICLSLRPGCKRDNVLKLWRHECQWIYGNRMVSEVDLERYEAAFVRSIRKMFSDEDQIQLLIQSEQPLFSNLVEQDGGFVTAGNNVGNKGFKDVSEAETDTDVYMPHTDVEYVKALLQDGLDEYNKTHPRIKLALYRSVIQQVCRLARVMSSPHEVAHTCLVAEGCPGRCITMAKLAANLCGFQTFKISPSPMTSTVEYKIDTFKSDIVNAYTRAGVKSEKTLFLIEEEELVDEDFLVFVTEFIVSSDITPLFNFEERTTIINSIRTDVTQAGLTYTRDVAWDFFLRTVQTNFRICFIASSGGKKFQKRCREYPAFTKNINFIWFPHWPRAKLVEHAAFHLEGVNWMIPIQRENLAHMLASMHLVLRQQDGQELTSGEYNHITNTSYEKFVEKFIYMANARYKEIHDNHGMVSFAMRQIDKENKQALKLKRQLEHEKIVFEERKAGTIKILAQIGQDTAITEQQIKIVKAQMEKIQRLKKLLPEYQVSHERAVYKAIAIVADTKKVVSNMNIDSLHEMRAMQKPLIDIEDLMAAIIMIVKSPQADLTWQKGAKRQMANIERFIDELMSFDDNQLPEATLNLVEPYLKKSSFDPDNIEKKSGNVASSSLCKWVRGVVRYHRMMISKVKPLHNKVEQTTQAVENAEQKMRMLENKRKALEMRLADLAKGFEEATIDKNDQEDKTIKMDRMLDTAARLRKILKSEHLRFQQIYKSLDKREMAIPGGIAMASAFATYLGPYHYSLRRLMLTVHWPTCLRERGIPLVIDSINPLRGRVVDFSIQGLKTASGASDGFDDFEEMMNSVTSDEGEADEEMADDEDEEIANATNEDGEEEEKEKGEEDAVGKEENEDKNEEDIVKEGDIGEEEKQDTEQTEKEADGLGKIEEEAETEAADPADNESIAESTASSTVPLITASQYNQYVRSLVKLMVGENILNSWIKKDLGPRQIENAAILKSSWQRPPLLIDPYGDGLESVKWLSRSLHSKKLVDVDMTMRTEPSVMVAMEKAIMKGKPLLLKHCEETIDNVIMPLIDHRNTSKEMEQTEESRMIIYCGRRSLCHPTFHLYMSTDLPKPKYSATVACTTTLVNYGISTEAMVDDLLARAFTRVRPELYRERRLALKGISQDQELLIQIADDQKQDVNRETSLSNKKHDMVVFFNEEDVNNISSGMQAKVKMAGRLRDTQQILQELDNLREEMYPIARRGALLFALLRSLGSIHREYQFTQDYFLLLFDEAVGDDLPPDMEVESDTEEAPEEEESADTYAKTRVGASSAKSATGGQLSARDISDQKSTEQSDKKDGDDEEIERSGSGVSKKSTNQDESNKNEESKEDGQGASTKSRNIIIPEGIDLPSEGVEYESLSANQIKQIVDKMTAHIFNRIHRSLFEEHRLLFATMLCLNIQVENGEKISDEEMAILLQGNPGIGMTLTLADFDCNSEIPRWLPKDKWEDVFALSVLPGSLDSLCVHIACNSEVWEEWYKSDLPEVEPCPLAKGEENDDAAKGDDEENEEDSGQINDFHQLLLIRILRPDRFPTAMSKYIEKNLDISLSEEPPLTIEDVTKSANGLHNGLFILVPSGSASVETHSISTMKYTHNVADILCDIAEKNSIEVERMILGQNIGQDLNHVVELARQQKGWLIIQNLHLASEAFFSQLITLFKEMKESKDQAKENEESDTSGNFCIWITSEPSDCMPLQVLQQVCVISWDMIASLETPQGATNTQDATGLHFTDGSTEHSIIPAISTALKSLKQSDWNKTNEFATQMKTALFGVGVVQGVLIVRQLYGARGVSQWNPLSRVQIQQAIDILCGGILVDKSSGTANMENFAQVLCDLVYKNLMPAHWDQQYVWGLIQHVMSSVIHGEASIKLGDVEIPVPPANVEPANFGTWLEEKVQEDFSSVNVLSLNASVQRERNESSGADFIKLLEHIYSSQNDDLGDIRQLSAPELNMEKLRISLDLCLESFPPLLELGDIPQKAMFGEYDFPYHRPSVLSMASASTTMMPESLGFVLLQECQWLNSLLCHARQNIHTLQSHLLGGPEIIPGSLLNTAQSLQQEQVPMEWIHPNCQPSTHTLMSWLQDMKKRYQQLREWVKLGMVPTFTEDHMMSQIAPRGHLESLWIGGLVNPQALFTALRQEKAVVSGTTIDQVSLACDVLEDDQEMDIEDEGGLIVNGLSLQGASWDSENGTLSDASACLFDMPRLYIRPVVIETRDESQDEEKDQNKDTEAEEQMEKYQCPVFMNKARQVCVCALPIPTAEPQSRWINSGTALILDTGVPEGQVKKSRSYAAPKPSGPPVMASRSIASATPAPSRADTHRTTLGSRATTAKSRASARAANLNKSLDKGEEEQETEAPEDGGQTHRSNDSQLSYKKMSPQASPLPPDLMMTRDKPVKRDDDLNSNNNADNTNNNNSEAQLDGSNDNEKYKSTESLAAKSEKSYVSKKSSRYESKGSVADRMSEGGQSRRSAHDRSDSKLSSSSKKSLGKAKEIYDSKESLAEKQSEKRGSKESLASKKSTKSSEKHGSKESLSSKKSTKNSEKRGSKESLSSKKSSKESGKYESNESLNQSTNQQQPQSPIREVTEPNMDNHDTKPKTPSPQPKAESPPPEKPKSPASPLPTAESDDDDDFFAKLAADSKRKKDEDQKSKDNDDDIFGDDNNDASKQPAKNNNVDDDDLFGDFDEGASKSKGGHGRRGQLGSATNPESRQSSHKATTPQF
ncbi:unnamed protein product [Owenia fusiformis]|uniref:Uncharacterized protein n=1 Tax=Owenia fusiformis TaxID=6347 RepID=A0A8S4PUE3_OWEFU|nr:unnamed protein product [Owenia fusiformis]